MDPFLISIDHLNYRYPGQHQPVFSDLSLHLEGGRIYGLLGKNGTGKSTLLYLVSGLLRPAKGSAVKTGGHDSFRRAPEMLRDIYLVAEEDTLPDMPLDRFAALTRPFYPRFSEATLHECLRDFGLDAPSLQLKSLSMGQRKKVAISLAIASGCPLLLMDEPTNGLDIPSKALFRQVVASHIGEGRTLVISTHQVHDVETLLDHVVIIDQSRVLLNASVGDITARYAFRAIPEGESRAESVIYAEPCPMGMAAILRRKGDEPETQLNLELLFDAAIRGKINYPS